MAAPTTTATTNAGETLDRVGTALADPIRRQILLTLLGAPAYPADLADMAGTTRSNLSNHLACLRGCGLVRATPEGRRVRYEIADPTLADALRQLASVRLHATGAHTDLDGRR